MLDDVSNAPEPEISTDAIRAIAKIVSQSAKEKAPKPPKPDRQTQLDTIVSRLATMLEQNNHWLGFAGGSDWWVYDRGYWAAMTTDHHAKISRILADICREVDMVYAEKQAAVWAQLEVAYEFEFSVDDLDRQPMVSVLNGTLNIETMELVPDSRHNMTTRFVDINFDPDATCDEWKQILDAVLSDRAPDTRTRIIGLIQEWMGFALAGGSSARTPRELRKALFLYGPPRAGKSTVAETVQKLLGTARVTASRPGDITKEFGLEEFIKAAAWITEEVDGLSKADPGRVKCLITGEPVSAKRKFKESSTLRFNGPVLWAGNTRPNFPENSEALYTRMMVIAMERAFTEKEATEKFGNSVRPIDWLVARGEMPGIFVWALEGYKRLLKRGRYEQIEDLQDSGDSWREQNDGIYAFLKECCEPDEDTVNTTTTVSWAAFAYLRATRNEFTKLQTIRTDLKNNVPSVFPNVKVDRIRLQEKQRLVYTGLKLNTAGLMYLKRAASENEACAEDTAGANQKALGRGNDDGGS
jgi:P4 family phage/plasmid primase-like protien